MTNTDPLSGGTTPMGEPRDPRFQELEDYALSRAMESKKAEVRQKWLDISKTIRDAEKVKQEADEHTRDAAREHKRFLATTLVPAYSVVIALVAVCVQGCQVVSTSKAQEKQAQHLSDQLKATIDAQKQQAELLKQQNEDSKWRELLKSVSFETPEKALVGALAVEGFFDSDQYKTESRAIATALLPTVNNVNAFDEIVDVMESKTNEQNQRDLSSISKMLLYRERERYGLNDAVTLESKGVRAFLQHDISSIDPNPPINLPLIPCATRWLPGNWTPRVRQC